MAFSAYTVVCLVDGRVTPYERYQTRSGIDQVGDATVTLRRPLPAHVTTNANGGSNAPAGKKLQLTAVATHWTSVVSGVRQNLVVESGTIFRGTILSSTASQDPARVVSVSAQDDLWRMQVATTLPQAWDGPISADTLIRGLFALYGYGDSGGLATGVLPLALDALRFPDGSGLTLGGIAEIDDGQVVLRAGQNRLAFARELAAICGYSVFSTPSGVPRMCRTMGIPPAVGTTDPLRSDGGYRVISESDDTTFRVRGTRDAQTIANYVEVTGASYQEDDGSAIDIRSFPLQADVVDPLLVPPEVSLIKLPYSSSFITTQQQANGARTIREQDRGGVPSVWTVSRGLMPLAYPGHVHKLVSPTNGLNSTHYVEAVSHQGDSSGGHTTTLDYRRGAGTAQPAGVDRCLFQTLLAGTTHIGDETRANYLTPAPFGLTRDIGFTPAQVFGSLAIVARAHGTNSQLGAGGNVALEGSKVELIQQGQTVGSATLPVLDEDLTEARAYSDDANWTDVEVAISGTLKQNVPATLRLTSANGDDFEVKAVRLKTCEQGEPLKPTYPRPPSGAATPPRTPGDMTSPGGGVGTQPNRAARVVLLNDGVARPGRPALLATSGFVIPKGRTSMTWAASFTGLLATTGTRGAGWSEYGRARLRTSAGIVEVYARLEQFGGGVAAGSGGRNMRFDVTAACANGAAELLTDLSGVYSESATVGVSRVYGTRAS